MSKLSILAIAAILVSISIVVSAEKYEFGSYNVSFRYPTPVVIINNNTTYENESIIYSKKFTTLLEEARIFSPFLGKLGGWQSPQVEVIDLEYFYIGLYKKNKSIEGNLSSKADQILLNWEKNKSTFFETWDGSPFAGKTVASKVDRPYLGLVISGPLENGLSLNMYFGLVNNLTAIYVSGQCPPDSFETILSTMKITPRENLDANEKPKELKSSEPILPKVELPNPELPNKEDTMPFSLKIIDIWQIAPILIGIIGIILTLRSRKRKSLGYELLAEASLLTVSKDLHEKIKIFFENKLIQDAWLLIYKISNNGDIPITETDFDDPISISFGNGVTILDAKIASTTPRNLKARLNILDSNKIILEQLLMNSSDSVIINIFLSGYIKGAWVAPEARIIDIKLIENINEFNEIKNIIFNPKAKYIYSIILLLIVLISITNPMAALLISMSLMGLILILIKYRFKIFSSYKSISLLFK